MPETAGESFSNPLAPSVGHGGHGVDMSHLTNDDFRKMLMTPRAAPDVAPPSVPSSGSSSSTSRPRLSSLDYNEDEDKAARRRKKKSYYAKLKKMEEEREQELASKYRDRAKERREGENPDYKNTDTLNSTASYRAVGPTAEATRNAEEQRRQAIQESKFLGGDMEHTHLVKGLDFALLQKVRSEITGDDPEEDEERKKVRQNQTKDEEIDFDDVELKTKVGQRIYRAVFKSKIHEKNELFMPGRMAYVFDLEDEYMESDIPTTTIRSKADCPSVEQQTTLTTNDIVIQKLTQILSYLRQGMRGNKKLKKKDKGKGKEEQEPHKKITEESIYGDIGDYDPNEALRIHKKKEKEKEKERERERERQRLKEREYERDRHRGHDRDSHRRDSRSDGRGDSRGDSRGSYFERPKEEEKPKGPEKKVSAGEFARTINDRFSSRAKEQEEKAGFSSFGNFSGSSTNQEPAKKKKRKGKSYDDIDHYSECYPGMEDAGDSDDEADYSKMDMGNKKGPLGRWDFDTQEEYSDYMDSREAMPKAAFQFGIKMSEGRKTRRTGPKDDKAKLDRDWQRISQILKRKKDDDDDDAPGNKKSRN